MVYPWAFLFMVIGFPEPQSSTESFTDFLFVMLEKGEAP